jgi:hypothetical protein
VHDFFHQAFRYCQWPYANAAHAKVAGGNVANSSTLVFFRHAL